MPTTGVRTVMKLTGTLRVSLVKVKQARPDRKKKGVVYMRCCARIAHVCTLERREEPWRSD